MMYNMQCFVELTCIITICRINALKKNIGLNINEGSYRKMLTSHSKINPANMYFKCFKNKHTMELEHFSEMMQPVLHDSQFHEISVFFSKTVE